jgi:hypothetical protein
MGTEEGGGTNFCFSLSCLERVFGDDLQVVRVCHTSITTIFLTRLYSSLGVTRKECHATCHKTFTLIRHPLPLPRPMLPRFQCPLPRLHPRLHRHSGATTKLQLMNLKASACVETTSVGWTMPEKIVYHAGESNSSANWNDIWASITSGKVLAFS